MRLGPRDASAEDFEMFDYDVCVIGGGILGCMAARNLTRRRLRSVLVEQREDVCTGISKANTAIVYAGYDSRPGTKKSELCVEGNKKFRKLCRELGVAFKQCGSIMVCFGSKGSRILEKKLENGIKNGVEGLRLLSRQEILSMEPNLSRRIFRGLYAPTTGVVNPWELGIAAFESARQNGCEMRLNTELKKIRRILGGYELTLEQNGKLKTLCVRGVLNCAGLKADCVREMVFPPRVRIFPNGADYLVFDRMKKSFVKHVIFHEPEEGGKGLTIVPTVDGNLLVGPSERVFDADGDEAEPSASSEEGLSFLYDACREVAPDLEPGAVIRNFAGIRPNPYEVCQDESGRYQKSGQSIHSFLIDQSLEEPGMVTLLGIKTPGLTCCDELTKYAVELLLKGIGGRWEPAENFQPCRKPAVSIRSLPVYEQKKLAEEDPAYGQIVCRCEHVTLGEIRDAVARGAVSIDGIKRRCRIGMGRCQGSRCTLKAMELLAQMKNIPVEEVEKDAPGSYIIEAPVSKGGMYETL